MIRRTAITMLLATLLLLPVVTTYGYTDIAAQSGTDTVYEDPAGRFTLAVPANWTVTEQDDIVTLTDPDGAVVVDVIVTTAASAEEGITIGLESVHPGENYQAVEGGITPESPQAGFDEALVVTFDDSRSSGIISQAFAQRVGDQVYVLFLEGPVDAADRRQAQINTIAFGLTVTGTSEIDLSGVTPASFTGALVDEFTAYAEELLTRLEVPGAAVVVIQNGEIVYTRGFGVRQLGGTDPVTPDTLMMIGSTSKSFTTLMMATMVDDGLFDWDTPVVDVLPSFQFSNPALTGQITMENLVCACTGVPRRDFELLFNANELTAEGVVQSLADFDLYTEVGESFQYSNQMVATGGYAATAGDGGVYGDLADGYNRLLQERVLNPIGMPRTTTSFLQATTDENVATPHGTSLTGTYKPIPYESEALLVPVAPAGALWSSANEMARYLQMQLATGVGPSGNRIVSAAQLLHTREPQVTVSSGVSYGLGWFVEDYKGAPMIDHSGGTIGFTSDFTFLPEAGIGIAVLANSPTPFNEALRFRLLELVYDQPAEYDAELTFAIDAAAPAIAELEANLGDAFSPAEISTWSGTYANDALGQIVLANDPLGHLLLDSGEFTCELRPFTADQSGQPNATCFDGPIVGTPFVLTEQPDGTVQILIDTGIEQYLFEEATP